MSRNGILCVWNISNIRCPALSGIESDARRITSSAFSVRRRYGGVAINTYGVRTSCRQIQEV
jgi:hypothetical protein